MVKLLIGLWLIMRKKYCFLIMGAIGVFVLNNSAFAYLDPGTGSAIAGSIWPLIVAFFSAIGAFFVRKFWNPIKGIFSRKKS